MTIRTRLYVLFGIMLVITLAAGMKTWQTVSEYSDFNATARMLLRKALEAEKVQTLIYSQVDYVRTAPRSESLAECRKYYDNIQRQVDSVASLAGATESAAGPSEEKKRIRELRERYERLHELLMSILQRVEETESPAGFPDVEQADEIKPLLNRVRTAVDRLVVYYEGALLEQVSTSGETGFRALLTIAVASLLTALILATLFLVIGGWLLSPLEELGAAAERIGSGDLEHRLALLSHDEIGKLGRSFNDMASKLRLHQKRLIEARELAVIGAMSSSVAHGMRNPLAGIRVTAQFLAGSLEEDDPTQERVRDIIDEVDRMTHRIGALLDFGRPSEIRSTSTNLRDLIAPGIREAQAALDEHGIVVTIDNSVDDLAVRADADKIVLIIAEILTNAALHAGDGITVTISAHRESASPSRESMAVLSIQDRGKGMDEPELEQAFDLFFTTRQGGSGMGLACAKRIAELHGGRMEIHSTPAEGTRVSLVLPETPRVPSIALSSLPRED